LALPAPAQWGEARCRIWGPVHQRINAPSSVAE
jgi:hypothetical protein